MRLLVNCPSGESRLLQVDDSATVKELKQELQELEGIPTGQQVLCFAGKDLKDHLTLADHELQEYTLSDEVVLYLNKKRAHPKHIYLVARSRPHQKVAEIVESDMPVGDVMALLVSRGLAEAFPPGTPIFCKRQDGSTVPLKIDPMQSLSNLEGKIKQAESVACTALTFVQAQDGAMHVVLWPSSESSLLTYPVYSRDILPQKLMPKKDAGTGQPFNELVHELCILP
ncbi:hypothetical protein CEUSTIGMA_g2172.t1 [Chlamydomonas eustigma]|uniref:Ubiquitin-like domain-containing protein n=1 Tax=Chlamydomonas eustigma TaxID=1157962 RepID=A0A250WV95_9CHLO|nr:hypothetical protein CEUSTIGMA_g2172.t1 [Chlamydomonas eustigma]|eukprot:GAX74725.1 hypothetical protein CEUSTIGMA_g2172.t1 [Chlamydomonas eustigma]